MDNESQFEYCEKCGAELVTAEDYECGLCETCACLENE